MGDERQTETAEHRRGAVGPSPEVSVVIPVRNEEESLPDLIEALRAQTHAPAEIIIVDGGSTDGTVSVARRLAGGDGRFRVIEAGEATPGRGRNVGTAEASCEWVAYIDAGIRAEPSWLERLVEAARSDASIEVVYGNYEPVTDTFFEHCAALTYPSPKLSRPGGARTRGPSIASSLVRRDVWKRVGGFPDMRATEDLIFMERIEAAGCQTGWAPKAIVWWRLQPTLSKTFRRFLLYSRHNVWAGRQRFWHYGLARQYALALVFLALAMAHSPWWLLVPAFGLLARAAKSIWIRGGERARRLVLDPARLGCVSLIILTIDAATFIGWAQALRRGAPQTGVRRAAADESKS